MTSAAAKSAGVRSRITVVTVVINVVLYQLGWFACVLGAAHGLPWIGPLAAAAIIAWHLARAARARPELALVACAVLLGALFDTLLVQSGWVHFSAGALIAGTAPCWMMALWAIFATTLNVSLRSLRAHPVLALILGALGGPLAYFAGARLGAITLVAAGPALSVIALGWAVLTPVLLLAARRFDGYAQP
jgi:hypothetical protein